MFPVELIFYALLVISLLLLPFLILFMICLEIEQKKELDKLNKQKPKKSTYLYPVTIAKLRRLRGK